MKSPTWLVVCRLLVTALVIACAGCSSSHDATAAKVDDGPMAAFRSEAADLRRLLHNDCRRCYMLRVFHMSFPIPSRYALIPKVKRGEACIGLVAPADEFLRPTPGLLDDIRGPGLMRICRVDVLDAEINKLSREHPPGRSFVRAGLMVHVWEPYTMPILNIKIYRTYIRSDAEGLMISDPNPLLWDEMFSVAETMNER